jgi:4-hydroxy-tetrahydrodipicolinate reductase
MSITLAIGGAGGRLGEAVRRLATEFDVRVLIEAKAGGEFVDRLTQRVDVLVDFSTPEGTLRRASECAALGTGIVVGTTGLQSVHHDALRAASAKVPVLVATNMSVGVQGVLSVLPALKRALAGFDVDLVETHHTQKKDAPSGTALTINEALGGTARVHSIRAGSDPGTHEIVFGGQGESVTITHRALTRDIFAAGALRAARFIAKASPGFYAMSDVLR